MNSTELEELKTSVPKECIFSCTSSFVLVHFNRTKYRRLGVAIQAPEDYPDVALFAQLKSNTLPPALLKKLEEKLSDSLEAARGSPQVLLAVESVRRFLDDNALIAAWSELKEISSMMAKKPPTFTFKLNQKTGNLKLDLKQGEYEFKCTVSVPLLYPEEPPTVSKLETSFGRLWEVVFQSLANEKARFLCHGPVKPKPNEPPYVEQASLLPMVRFLVEECMEYYTTGKCALCGKALFPSQPKDMLRMPPNHPLCPVRLYCSHVFHFGCVDSLMRKPPFTTGKECKVCKKLIYHKQWSSDLKANEKNWAMEEARQREIGDVADFLQVKEFADLCMD